MIRQLLSLALPNFLAMMARNVKGRKDIQKVYNVFDRDDNNSISVTELRQILTNFGEKITVAEFHEIWSDLIFCMMMMMSDLEIMYYVILLLL